MNDRCTWYNTPWMVQINSDGTVPEPKDHRGEPKLYQGFELHDSMAKRVIDQLNAEAELQTNHDGHGEIRRRS
jgi:hypothetical protein